MDSLGREPQENVSSPNTFSHGAAADGAEQFFCRPSGAWIMGDFGNLGLTPQAKHLSPLRSSGPPATTAAICRGGIYAAPTTEW